MTDEQRAKNREKARKYRETHREYFRAYDRARAQRRSESKRAWREENKDHVNQSYRQYVAAHPELEAKKKAKSAEWHAEHREHANKDRSRRWFEKYGMAPGDYEVLLAAQGGVCAICKTDRPRGAYNRFHVDHCHKTGRVRGLLCHSCNLGIGHLRDSIPLLEAAIDYLKVPDPAP